MGDVPMVMRPWRVADLLKGVKSLGDLKRVIEVVEGKGWGWTSCLVA